MTPATRMLSRSANNLAHCDAVRRVHSRHQQCLGQGLSAYGCKRGLDQGFRDCRSNSFRLMIPCLSVIMTLALFPEFERLSKMSGKKLLERPVTIQSSVTTAPLFEMQGIRKTYRDKVASNGVDFAVGECEVVGLISDNGAGKLNLIKVLTGLVQPDSGVISHRGKPVSITTPANAHALGIEPLGVDRRIETLSSGEQHAVMIGRAIHFGGDLLVMDKPTSAQSTRETDKVLGYVQNARDNLGKSVIFITHIIRRIYLIADILRDQIDRKALENLAINGPEI